jgi:hypothetical protein
MRTQSLWTCAALFAACASPAVSPDAGSAPDASPSDAAGSPVDAGVLAPFPILVSERSVREHEGNLAVASDGHVLVTGTALTRSSYDVFYRASTDFGATWGEIGVLPRPDDSNIASNASLVARDDGSIFVTWVSQHADAMRNRTHVRLWLAELPPGATVISSPTLVSIEGMTSAVDLPDLSITSDGTFLVTYTSFDDPLADYGIAFARSRDRVTWERGSVTASDPAASYGFGRLCASGSRTYLVYADFEHGIFVRHSDDGGATWPGERTTVPLPTELDFFAALGGTCVARGDELWVLYGRVESYAAPQPLLTHVRVAHSPDRGASFDRTVDAADALGGERYLLPALAAGDDGALNLTYYAGLGDGDTAATFRRTRSIDGGRTFSPSSEVASGLLLGTSRSSSAWPGDYTGLVELGGLVFGAFCETSLSEAHVAFFRSPL